MYGTEKCDFSCGYVDICGGKVKLEFGILFLAKYVDVEIKPLILS